MFWQILETLVMVWCCPSRSPLLKRTWKENIFINHICTAGANSNISFLEGWAALLVVKWTQKVNRTTLGESSTATIVLINESLRSKQKKRTSKPLLSYFSMCQSRAQSELHTSYKACRDFLMKKKYSTTFTEWYWILEFLVFRSCWWKTFGFGLHHYSEILMI